jgi:hypothetical protein
VQCGTSPIEYLNNQAECESDRSCDLHMPSLTEMRRSAIGVTLDTLTLSHRQKRTFGITVSLRALCEEVR